MAPRNAPSSRLRPLQALLPFALRYKWRIGFAFVALVAASVATLIVPIALRRVVDFGFFSAERAVVDQYFIAMLGVAGLLALASSSRYYLVMTLGERVVADLRSAVAPNLTKLSPAFYDGARAGELVSRLAADTTLIKSAFGASASVALRNTFLFFGAAIMMVVTSPRLSALVLLAIPLIVLPLVAFGRAVQRRSRTAQDTLADASALAGEAISSMRTVQAFTAEAQLTRRFDTAVQRAYKGAQRATLTRAVLTAVIIFIVFACVVAILWWGATDVFAGRMTPGVLGQFVLYAVFAAGALAQISEVSAELLQAAGAAERLDELLRMMPAVRVRKKPARLPSPLKGKIGFDFVRFAYPARSHSIVLKDISFDVKAGETVALVGPSGAGKSTIFHLLLRFYDPQRGRVLIDGVDIRTTDLNELRSRIALVPQEPAIFATTARENIRFGRPDATDEEVEAAAKDAAADEFLRALPKGYDTEVGERGVTLSGGQRQRIAIARAILRDAPILLLDEATSSLDAENEAAVQEALGRLMKGRTTIVVAHRLATVQNADRILVLNNGRIVEEGTHKELAKMNGLYARLAQLQFV